MVDEQPANAPERFGTNWILRAASGSALCLWLLATTWVLVEAGIRGSLIPGQTFISLVFFDFLFTVAVFYYYRRAIIVDDDGVIVMGALSFQSYRWQDLISVEPDPGYLPGYHIVTRSGAFGFSCLEINSHRRLHALLSEGQRRGRRPEAARAAPETPDSRPGKRRHAFGRRRVRRPGRRA